MRVVLQRVSQGSCTVDGIVTGSIEKGLVILVGVEEEDTDSDLTWLSQKIGNMRIFNDENNLMNLSIQDIGGEILIISQFTLFALTKKGNRPSFIRAAKPQKAELLYEALKVELAKYCAKPIQCGVFGADMKIQLINDGPVTILMDSRDRDNH